MPIEVETISEKEADDIQLLEEGQFADVKAKEKAPKSLSEDISAFANSDGGDLYIGITDPDRYWIGFDKVEAANGFLQLFEDLFPLGNNFQYRFLKCTSKNGLVLHVSIEKTEAIMRASNGRPYIRRGAQSLPVDNHEKMKRLELAKGIASFESELANVPKEVITQSAITKKFVEELAPTTTPEPWLKKQFLIRNDKPSVAGVLLFAEEPQAILQKHCGIKVYQYKTKEAEGTRDELVGTPLTIEGHLYRQIQEAVKLTLDTAKSVIEAQEGENSKVFPYESIHEIITNAVLHRDYSIKDDIHIRIFDDRIEIQSPGKLPAHITVENILQERYARNGTIVRLLNKFPDPPNKDIGEGLKTAFAKMNEVGLKEPIIRELDNSVLVMINHHPI